MAKQCFNKEYLIEILKKDNATLLGDYTSFNRDIKPKFRCRCGKEENNRTFRDISTKGAFCHNCVYEIASKQRNKTVKEVYGVECVSQIISVKAKRVTTNIKRHGVAVPFQSAEVKEKSRITCLERYGAEYPGQSEEVKNKIKATNLKKYGSRCSLQSDSAKEKTLITLQEKYGENIINAFQAEEVKNKIRCTNMERLGVEYPSQSEEVKNKIRGTNMERLGVKYPGQSAEVKEKSRITCLERYDVVSPLQNKEIMEKVKATNLERYGVVSPLQNKEIMEKVKATNLERYGVEHVLQNKEIMEHAQKNAKKYKSFEMPSGAVRKVQGYEPFALNILVKVYEEEQIKTDRKDVPRVQYEVDGKKKYHFPDIFIPHENKLIEVKSTWTLNCKTDNIKLKKKACEKRGFLYEIWCFDGKGNRVEVPV